MTLAAWNLAAAAFMGGVIWVVQVVHYPLFAGVGRDGWAAYEAQHQRRITWVVLPAMTANVLLALALLAEDVGSPALRVANAALACGVFAATGAVYAPLHGRLARGWDEDLHARLVRWNWWRTAAWTAQTAVAVALLV